MELSSSIIVSAFEKMGGDSTNAIDSAKNYSSISSWIASQAGQAAAVGAGAMLIPGAHTVAIIADVAFLLHKMAYCCWGIGEISDCIVIGKSDFQNILALWSGASSIHDMPHKAIKKATLEAAIVSGSTTVAGLATAEVLSHLSGQQIAQYGGKFAGKLAGKKLGGKVSAKLGAKLGTKIGTKVGAKLSAKLGAKLAAGFVPLIGPIVGGSVNAYFVKNIADSADLYYSKTS